MPSMVGEVHRVEQRRQIALELRTIDGAHDVVGAVSRRDLGRQGRLVERQPLELGEGQRDGRHIADAKIGHRAEQRT